MPSKLLTKDTLPHAIRTLLSQNNYDVRGPEQINGAEVDLIAIRRGDPFSPEVYIEATVEYVDNDKYGKDVGKLAMIAHQDPRSRLLIVSSQGFSLPVKERAKASGIETLTYEELFARFESFGSYLNAVLTEGDLAVELTALERVYIEPAFHDVLGNDAATSFLARWRDDPDTKKRWLIVVGEYGTGKTALTKVLQRRWALQYHDNPSMPIPFRMELRQFTRQFDAKGLVHQFLDSNRLSHLSIDFVFSLIRSGRIVLLLDGYDEMAQYMQPRERRACLEALAELSADGARGILTSRPNYFTEAEEFQVFEILYATLKQGQYYLSAADHDLVSREKYVDQLIEAQFLNRYERTLKDLSDAQTEQLVERSLASDLAGKTAVLNLVRRVFRERDEGAATSLSGKPVIISYLLQVVEDLKRQKDELQTDSGTTPLSEWEVYKLIVDSLMIRDVRRSHRILPGRRRSFLRVLAVWLSRRDNPSVSEGDFIDLIQREFRSEFRRLLPEDKQRTIDQYFEDLRSSATLTRSAESGKPGWRFSHNSLREFLVAEHLIECLKNEEQTSIPEVPISDAMRIFVASKGLDELSTLAEKLREMWAERKTERGAGQMLVLLWDGISRLFGGDPDPAGSCLQRISGKPVAMNDATLNRLRFSTEERPASLEAASFNGSMLSDIDLCFSSCQNSDFSGAVLENTLFREANLSGALFRRSFLLDVELTEADVMNCDFREIDVESTILVRKDGGTALERLQKSELRGYLRYRRAVTDDVSPYFVAVNDRRYPIIEKICAKLYEQTTRQRHGLAARGAARQDNKFARAFVDHLEKHGLIREKTKNLVSVTELGRDAFARIVTKREIPSEILSFIEESGMMVVDS
jgi:hypothetical protein